MCRLCPVKCRFGGLKCQFLMKRKRKAKKQKKRKRKEIEKQLDNRPKGQNPPRGSPRNLPLRVVLKRPRGGGGPFYGGSTGFSEGTYLPYLSLSFLCFFWWYTSKTLKKTRIFDPHRPLKLLGKEGKNAQKSKENLRKEKHKKLQKARKGRITILENCSRDGGVGSVVVGFRVFGAPRFSVQRSPNPYF